MKKLTKINSLRSFSNEINILIALIIIILIFELLGQILPYMNNQSFLFDTAERFDSIFNELRLKNLPTVPSTLEEELKSNIFLRCDQNELKIKLNMENSDDYKVFKKVRDLKDTF